jgi:hypothetical protein
VNKWDLLGLASIGPTPSGVTTSYILGPDRTSGEMVIEGYMYRLENKQFFYAIPTSSGVEYYTKTEEVKRDVKWKVKIPFKCSCTTNEYGAKAVRIGFNVNNSIFDDNSDDEDWGTPKLKFPLPYKAKVSVVMSGSYSIDLNIDHDIVSLTDGTRLKIYVTANWVEKTRLGFGLGYRWTGISLSKHKTTTKTLGTQKGFASIKCTLSGDTLILSTGGAK